MTKKFVYTVLLIIVFFQVQSQNIQTTFGFNEFLGYVKKYHPLVKQADLKLNEAQANLMLARGAFDPKIEVDFNDKMFKDKTYYSILNSSFKIPTWYGIELKAGFNQAEGLYLNPENTAPISGLTTLGISIPLGQGLLVNQRMTDIRKAKIAQKLNVAERNLKAVDVIYEAAVSYVNWKKCFDEVQRYQNYLNNTQIRYKGVLQLIEQGDKPAIDSIEAGIAVKTRQLNMEEAQLKLTKAKLELSNYLWLEGNIPLELKDELQPESQLKNTIKTTLQLNDLGGFDMDNHPKIKALDAKIAMLIEDKKLKANALLPKIDLQYNYLSEPKYWDNFRLHDYKIGVQFSMPIFLRKERASLKLAQLKIQDSELSLQFERKNIDNKIKYQQQEIQSLDKQYDYITKLARDYATLLTAEDRLFAMGESSLFIINSRENALVTAQINEISIENKYLNSVISLYKTLANPE
ncbi:transporter [Flavobacterium branchiophilum]|uniref:Outer membrane protein TolC n=1 Tax=Flavobacterium branchiophilum TaxID=55197 RepID=A0A543G567_9FLAO|nr:TolC family protein [Flavobacterium branchiophilum]OXA78091.1 transporter [Flavobacterium branchiophilum] [Flavobacterium branchiophilum NBRC 15030 = ATCC 35035]TQM41226.1 outer membrane protein TolC [Flavobacterium branchiophilum]GEM54416.1 transporter [Flavobacterium branchiophilum NBRC 15030 = ATCC 35035]